MATNRCFDSYAPILSAREQSGNKRNVTIYNDIHKNIQQLHTANPVKIDGYTYNDNSIVNPSCTNTTGYVDVAKSYEIIANIKQGALSVNPSKMITPKYESWCGNLYSVNYKQYHVNNVVQTDTSFSNIVVDPSNLLFYSECDLNYENTNKPEQWTATVNFNSQSTYFTYYSLHSNKINCGIITLDDLVPTFADKDPLDPTTYRLNRDLIILNNIQLNILVTKTQAANGHHQTLYSNGFNITNYGTIFVGDGGVLYIDHGSNLYSTNSGVIIISWDPGTLIIDGAFNNSGNFANESVVQNNGTIVNDGTTTNSSTAVITNVGTITNNNSIVSTGAIINDSLGAITNNNVIISSNSITNAGTITNNNTLTNDNILLNDGLITNNSASTLNNNNIVTNNGTIINIFNLNNNDTVINNGLITNYSTLNNNNALTNNGLITNNSTLNNNGSISNNNTLNNNGVLAYFPASTIDGNYLGGTQPFVSVLIPNITTYDTPTVTYILLPYVTVPSGSSLTITNITLVIPSDVTLGNNGIVVVDATSVINNQGTISTLSAFINQGNIYYFPDSNAFVFITGNQIEVLIINIATLNLDGSYTLLPNVTVPTALILALVSNTLIIPSDVTLGNNGTITIDVTSVINVYGTLNNNNIIINDGHIYYFPGSSFIGTGTITGSNPLVEVLISNIATLNLDGSYTLLPGVTVPSGSTLALASNTLIIPLGVTLAVANNGIMTIDSLSTLYIYGTLNNNAGATLTNDGTINNYNVINNDGILTNNNAIYYFPNSFINGNAVSGNAVAVLISNIATLNLDGSYTFLPQVIIPLSSSITLPTVVYTIPSNITFGNNGTITTLFGGTLNIQGTLENSTSGLIINNGYINNHGILQNDLNGTIINNSTTNNYGTINNAGTINIYGPIYYFPGSTVTGTNYFATTVVIDNIATLNLDGSHTLLPSVTVPSGSTLALISNYLTIPLGVTLNNNGAITIDDYSGIQNDDTIINSGTITINATSSSLTGTLYNYGIVTNDLSGNIVIYGGFINAGTLNNNSTITTNLVSASYGIGIIQSAVTINNNVGAIITNNAFIVIDETSGEFNNYGTLINNNEVYNINIINNHGTLINNNKIYNDVTINNYSLITTNNSSNNYIYFTYVSSFINNQGGIIQLSSIGISQMVLNAGLIYNFNAGQILNGTIDNIGGSIYNGDGINCGVQGTITSTFITGGAINTCPP